MDEQKQQDEVLTDDLPVDDLQSQLDAARQEIENNLNGWKRAQADLQNFQAGQEKKNKELVEFAREVALAKLLPSLDSLGQALRHSPRPSSPHQGEGTNQSAFSPVPPPGGGRLGGGDDFSEQYQTWLSGIAGIIKQLDKALEELGVQKIEALGKKFDPNLHEAIKEINGAEEGIIVEEFVTGYTINGKVVRPSGVGIGKGV